MAIVASATGASKDYGEFSLDDNLECHKLGFPPWNAEEIDTKFYMYTTENSENPDEFSQDTPFWKIENAGFKSSRQTFFFTHGYQSYANHSSTVAIYRNWTNLTGGANVFAVDWRKGANVTNYNIATQNIRVVGNQIAIFANNLGQDFTKITFCGHSLGAHASGYAGEAVELEYSKTVSRITGLDPAGPGFRGDLDRRCRLDPSDADFVDNIHTDVDQYGTPTDMGHVDFYPNGGSKQPGCPIDLASCSHGRAVDLYCDSISTCTFYTERCDAFNRCTATSCYMGYGANRAECSERRYLETYATSPFCKPQS